MPAPNGFVQTPEIVADFAASIVFGATRPDEPENPRILFPGLGTGRLYDAAKRYCTAGEGWPVTESRSSDVPECVGVENDHGLVDEFHDTHPDADIDVHEADFLLDAPDGEFDWVLMNPPFMRYKRIDTERREQYRNRFTVAEGQFGLHSPFVEQALKCLTPGGWLTTFLPIAPLVDENGEQLRTLIRTHGSDPRYELPYEVFDAKVATALVTFQYEPGAKPNGNHYIHTLRRGDHRDILDGLGVDDHESAMATYRNDLKHTQRLINRIEKRKDDAEYITNDDGVIVDIQRETGVGANRQASLGEW